MSPTGHLAIGFAAKKYAPQIPLIAFLIAAYAIDLLYFIFLIAGLDRMDYNPWSHSLLMAIFWSVSASLITWVFSRKLRGGLMIGFVVFSHWILDIIVWDNIPVVFEKTHRIGFGLYNRIGFSLTGLKLDSGTMIATGIELGMLLIGLSIYIVFLRKLRRNEKTV